MKLVIPRETANDDTVTITFVASQEYVSEGDILLVFETSKSQYEEVAPVNGYFAPCVSTGDEVSVGDGYGELSDDVAAFAEKMQSQEPDPFSSQMIFSDKARSMIAAGAEVDRCRTEGLVWVVSKDLTSGNYSRDDTLGSKANTHGQVLSRRKRIEIQQIKAANRFEILSCLGFEIQGIREDSENPFFARKITDLVCFHTNQLLNEGFSDLNGYAIDDENIAFHDSVICGIAFDDEESLDRLIVATIAPDVMQDLKSCQAEIEKQYLEFLESKSTVGEPTFTVSDLSGYKVRSMFPLVNGSQGLIIGITSNIAGYGLFISFDHRISSGLRVSQFANELCARIERYMTGWQSCEYCERAISTELQLGNKGLICLFNGTRQILVCRDCFNGW